MIATKNEGDMSEKLLLDFFIRRSDLPNDLTEIVTKDWLVNEGYLKGDNLDNIDLTDYAKTEYVNDVISNLTIPTKTSELINDSHYLTEDDLDDLVISLDTDDIENKSSVFGDTLTEALNNLDNKIHQAGNNFLGVYNTFNDLITAKAGTAIWGDYAYVGSVGSPVQQYIWDDYQQTFLKPIVSMDGGIIIGEQL